MADEELKIRFTGESSSAAGAADATAAALGKVRAAAGEVNTATGATAAGSAQAAAGFNNLSSSALNLKGAVSQLSPELGTLMNIAAGAGIATGVIALGKAAWTMGEIGASNERIASGYKMMAEEAGQAGDKVFAAMNKAARGTIEDEDLMLMANRAWLAGLKLNADQLGDLVEVAKVRAKAMGTSTAEAYDTALSGIIMGSSRILKRMGVQDIDLEYDKYAASIGKVASELTDAQRQTVVYNALVEQNASLVEKAAGAALSNADKLAQMRTQVDVAKDAVSGFLAPWVGGIAGDVARGIEGWTTATDSFAGAWKYLASLPVPEAIALIMRGGISWQLSDAAQGGGRRGAGGEDAAYTGQRTQPPEYYLPTIANSPTVLESELDMQVRYLAGRGVEVYKHEEAVKADKEALKDAEAATKQFSAAAESAANKMRSDIASLMTPTGVTEKDMLMTKLGLYDAQGQKWDETGRRYEDIIQKGEKSPWAAKMLPGMGGDQLKLAAMQGKESFYNFDWQNLPGADKEAAINALSASYQQKQQTEANQELIIDAVVAKSGGAVNKADLKKSMGLEDPKDTGADYWKQFMGALDTANPAQSFANKFSADVTTNKKALETAGVAAWTTIVGSLGKLDESPLVAFAHKLSPFILDDIDWNAHKNGAKP